MAWVNNNGKVMPLDMNSLAGFFSRSVQSRTKRVAETSTALAKRPGGDKIVTGISISSEERKRRAT